MQKSYSEDRSTESGFKSTTNITHIAPFMSVSHTSINSSRGGAMGTPEDEAKMVYHDYVEGLE